MTYCKKCLKNGEKNHGYQCPHMSHFITEDMVKDSDWIKVVPRNRTLNPIKMIRQRIVCGKIQRLLNEKGLGKAIEKKIAEKYREALIYGQPIQITDSDIEEIKGVLK